MLSTVSFTSGEPYVISTQPRPALASTTSEMNERFMGSRSSAEEAAGTRACIQCGELRRILVRASPTGQRAKNAAVTSRLHQRA
jgi:hypothetical protein